MFLELILNSIILSSLFKFEVGPEGKLIVVHSAAIADQSKALRTLIEGNMSEALGGCAVLKDTPVHIFQRFVQYAYTGDYPTPRSDISARLTTVESEIELEGEALRNHMYVTITKACFEFELKNCSSSSLEKWKKSHSSHPKKSPPCTIRTYPPTEVLSTKRFENLEYPQVNPRLNLSLDSVPFPNETPQENFTDVFLNHARLYVFAEKWGI
jgi:hypothetical protein